MKIFLGFLIFFLTFGGLVLLFAATGLFYSATVVLSILMSVALAVYILPYISLNNEIKSSRLFYFVAAIALAVSLATCYFATPTVFGGRDQGSIAAAAIELCQNHNFTVVSPVAHDLFDKYGAGRALNFPGFDYTGNGNLISRFPVGFTSYLAAYYNLFGLKGIQYANFIPLFLFLVIFWRILREFFDSKVSFLGLLIAASFFPFLWFAKFTLTEIYMLFLVWSGIYFLIVSFRGPAPKTLGIRPLYIGLAFFALSSLVRIEGIIFFLLAVIYIALLSKKKIISLPKNFHKYLFISTLFLLIIYIYLNFPALLDSAKNLAKTFVPDSNKESSPSTGLYEYLGRIFFNYNLVSYLVLGLAGIVWLGAKLRKNWLKIEFLIFFVTFPTFLYLLSPQITLDEPWFLRRFVFAVFPALIFYAIYFVNRFFIHKIFLYIVLLTLLASNIAVSARFFTVSENKNLLPQVEKISQKFEPDDLILVDRLATGSPYSLMSEPMRTLFGKNAVYFFNADDLKYINQDRYKNIYLIALGTDQKSWYSDLIKGKSFTLQAIDNNFLEPSDKKWALAQNVEYEGVVGIWKIK